jgi:general secretion pathway protein A
MYLDFYGLRENPFNLVTEPRFLYYSESHCEALAHLLYGVRERKGIMLMLGEAGTGKTTLVRATLDLLRQTRVLTSVILNPAMSSGEEMLDAVLRGFALEGYKRTTLDMSEVLHRFALQQTQRGRIPVLIVDEAQQLSRPLLEQVRLLSNLEAGGHKLLQIILSGQPEMNDMVRTHEMRAMRQRITVRCRLNTLNARETWSYLNFRLITAGGDGKVIFEADAVEAMYAFSGGIPRILNSLADNCLLAGYSRGKRTIGADIVESVAEHLELEPLAAPTAEGNSVHQEIVRASATWNEIAKDLRSAGVPPALRAFVENLQTPDRSDPMKMRQAITTGV